MFYKRHLPHRLPEGAVLHVRWRLANSRPAVTPEVLVREYVKPKPTGPMWLADPRIAQVVADALHFGQDSKHLYELFAFVIMPNHVHILIEPHVELAFIMRWLKGRTARITNRILGHTNQPFWQDESYDHFIRTPKEFNEAIYYIEENPVRAKLVDLASEWQWSSAFDRRLENDRLSHEGTYGS